jgi:PilZ domain
MQLVYETFSEIIGSLRSTGQIASDKRKNPRVGLRMQVELILHNGESQISAWLRDASANGVGLLVHCPIEKGAHFSIQMPNKDGISKIVPCTSCYCRKVGPELFNVGASLQL